ncbi:fungal pheromone STE3G-protein-coupled receptor [Artomyces pyxidatus]|uniref:Fungal pheromone STE3G-protein-coupled receptor n=1 Tax=Artomyces pyxidatus TaxID=48021 RepID=A0ACB8T2V0_9AGAM|nr:fungal pheromone STE3G-protein-coupled receptor [Artomyces pyxidatus]
MPDLFNIVVSVSSFLGFVLSLVPFYPHLDAGNAGTCLYMFWSAVSCLHQFINLRLWDGDTDFSAPTWCAISTELTFAEKVAAQAAALCIARRMYAIANNLLSSKRQEEIIDYSIGFGLPMFQVVFSLYNGNRTTVLEGTGCWPAIADDSTTYVLYSICPIAITLLATFFGVKALLSIRRFRRAAELSHEALKLDNNLYIRMSILVGATILVIAPLSAYSLYLTGTSSASFDSWLHLTNTRLGSAAVVPFADWKTNMRLSAAVELSRWTNVFRAFLFFALFGLSHDAIRHYRFLIYIAQGDWDWEVDEEVDEDEIDEDELSEEYVYR